MVTLVYLPALALSLVVPSEGAVSSWIGGDPVSPNWNLVLNWDVLQFQGVPSNDGTADVRFPATLYEPTHKNPFVNVPWNIYSLRFDSQYVYVLSGAALTIQAGIFKSGAAAGINNNIILGATQQFAAGAGPLTINGNIALGSHSLVAVPGPSGANIGITGVISGTGGLFLVDLGVLTLTGANTYTGGTVIRRGTLRGGASNVIPPGTVAMETGTLDLTGNTEIIGPGAVVATGLHLLGEDWSSPRVVIGTQLAISTLGTFIEGGYLLGQSDAGAVITGGPLTLGTDSGTREIRLAGFMVQSGTDLIIESAIVNPGGDVGVAPSLLKTDWGRLKLSGTNTFARGTRVMEGTLQIANGGALGVGGSANDGTQVSDGARLELSGGITVANEHLQLAGNGAGNGALSSIGGVNRWNGPIDLSAPTFIGVGSDALHIGGSISGAIAGNSLTKVGGGTLVLEAANSYLGPTNVAGGTLQVLNVTGSATGDGSVLVEAGAKLAGGGAIAGAVEVQGGTLAPGTSSGILALGGLTLDALSATHMELGGLTPGSGHDQVQVTNAVALGGTLQLTLTNGFVPALNDEFVLLTYASRTGTFASTDLPALPTGLQWALDYGPTALRARVDYIVGVDDALPRRHTLHPPVPNPSRRSVTVRFDLADDATVAVLVYDLGGREVARVLAPEWRPPGRYAAPWAGVDDSGRPIAAGTYFLSLIVSGRVVGPARAFQLLR